MERPVSTYTIAQQAGVSRTTVSFVLNGRKDCGIPAGTRDRVLRVAAELGYRPNGVARSLVTGKTGAFGVIVSNLSSSFTSQILDGLQDVCGERGYRLLLARSKNDGEMEVRQAELLLEQRVDAIVSIGSAVASERTVEWLEQAARLGVPSLLIDKAITGVPVDTVVTDDHSGAAAAVRHLLDLGHRRIGYLSAGTGSTPALQRLSGYRAALAAAGIPAEEKLVAGESFLLRHAAPAIEALLLQREPPTALFAANDYLAAAVLDFAAERDLRVPEDLALVGFGNVQLAHYLRLTTVHQSPDLLGRRAAEQLFARLADATSRAVHLVLPTQLVIRKSCGATGRTGAAPRLAL